MKNLVLTISIVGISICLNAQTKIIGHFQSMENWSNQIYLLAITDYDDVFYITHKYNIDTAMVDEKGNFEFQLDNIPCTECLYRIDIRPHDSPNSAVIFSGTSKENFALFELKNDQTIKIYGEANQLTQSFTLEGESKAWSYEEIRKLREPIYDVADQLYSQFTNPEFIKNIDSLKEAGIKTLISISEENNIELLKLMNSSTNIYDKIVGSKLYDYDMKMDNDIEIYDMVSKQLKETHPNHPYLIQLNTNIYATKFVLPIGSVAPPLSLTDVNGKQINLKDAGTNLILVDFWASWCSPCRHENKATVKPLYEAFKEKGFEVYSVSMDKQKDKWIKAIAKDGMTWLNVSDLEGTNSSVYSTYKIEGLPTTYLLEKKGFKIIAKNIRGEELRKFVEDYYTK